MVLQMQPQLLQQQAAFDVQVLLLQGMHEGPFAQHMRSFLCRFRTAACFDTCCESSRWQYHMEDFAGWAVSFRRDTADQTVFADAMEQL